MANRSLCLLTGLPPDKNEMSPSSGMDVITSSDTAISKQALKLMKTAFINPQLGNLECLVLFRFGFCYCL